MVQWKIRNLTETCSCFHSKDIDVPRFDRIQFLILIDRSTCCFFFRIQHLSSLLQVVQMEKVTASAHSRDPGMLADSSYYWERRVYSADS